MAQLETDFQLLDDDYTANIDQEVKTTSNPTFNSVLTDNITEKTLNNGVDVEGVVIKDGNVECSSLNGMVISPTEFFINPRSVLLNNMNCQGVLNTNTIEPQSGPTVRIEEVEVEDRKIRCDNIDEKTLNNGVNIENVLLKDGRATFGSGGDTYNMPASSFGAGNNDVLVFNSTSKNFEFKSPVCYTLQFGGNINGLNDYAVPQGDPNLTTNSTLDATKELIMPYASSLATISYSTSSGDATSVLGIWKNGIKITTAALAGAQGVINLPTPISVFSGDRITLSIGS